MQSRLRLLPSFLATILFAGIVAQAASCTLEVSGTGKDTTPPTPCNDDENCDDKDSCTLNVCNPSKVCEFPVIPGIAPEQVAGDCKRSVCTETGDKSDEVDDNDLPDDRESCTVDSCSNGTAVYEMLADGTSCTFGEAAGLCNEGKCKIECGPSLPLCNDGNPCTEDTCNANTGACSFAALDGLPTPDVPIVQGDCKQEICINGTSTAIADDADLPNDGDSCTTGMCVGGVAMEMATSAGAPCIDPNNMSGFCDEMGKKCVECSAPIHCPAPASPCQQRDCVNNVCVVNDLTGMEIPSTAGDCTKSVCASGGMPQDQPDNMDVPVDGNPCTNDVCTNGAPSNPNSASGTFCNGTLTCNGMGQCTGCTTNAACGKSDDCKTYTCVNPGPSGQCSISYVPVGMDPPNVTQIPGDCKASQCDGMGNPVTVVVSTDTPNDNNDCTTDTCDKMGNPSNAPKDLNTACGGMVTTVCDGLGNCLSIQGGKCTTAAECITGFCNDSVCCAEACTAACKTCNGSSTPGTCVDVDANQDDAPICTGTNSCDGMGSCKRDNGQPCGVADDCSSGFCADGVCCNSACDDTCKSCNLTGNAGTCTFVANDAVDPTGPMPCNNPYRCDGTGVCKGLNGVLCAQASECLSGHCVDGYCCNNVCNQLCKGCASALTGGSNGTCSNITNGTDPTNECPNGSCNGSGNCTGGPGLKIQGASCSSAGECLSGFCADGVCCNAGCTETCKTCNALGFCVDVANNSQDPVSSQPCISPYRCDGAGVCKGLNSVPCMMDSQCFSGYCTDGFCCNLRCSDSLCRSCASTFNAGADGTCGFTKAGSDPRNECNGGTPNCNGAGMCTP